MHGPLLYHKGEKALAKQKLHYFILRPLQGDILCIQKKETYDHIFKNENIPMNKLKGIEIIDLNLDIQSVYQSFRPIFSEKDQFAIELLPSDQDKASDIFFLSNFDQDNIQKWCDYLEKAKRFSVWYSHLEDLLAQ